MAQKKPWSARKADVMAGAVRSLKEKSKIGPKGRLLTRVTSIDGTVKEQLAASKDARDSAAKKPAPAPVAASKTAAQAPPPSAEGGETKQDSKPKSEGKAAKTAAASQAKK